LCLIGETLLTPAAFSAASSGVCQRTCESASTAQCASQAETESARLGVAQTAGHKQDIVLAAALAATFAVIILIAAVGFVIHRCQSIPASNVAVQYTP
jgi:hypothetical protein